MKTPNIPFMSFRKLAAMLSIALVVLSLVLLVFRGLNLGLDFTGGTQVEVAYPQAANIETVRKQLEDEGFEGASAQLFGKSTEVLVRIQPKEGEDAAKLGNSVFSALQKHEPELVQNRIEYVGPQVGEDLRDQSGSAMIFALILMLIYVTMRFRFKFALGAVVALFHDVIIVLGFFALTQIEFNLTVLAAVLAVIGYSLNDTIVVADRIRENFHALREDDSALIIDQSLNQTLGRTVITSVTTLLVLVVLALLGGEMIYAFSIALIVGIVIGTYSSIYVASNVLMAMNISREDFLVVETDETDDMP